MNYITDVEKKILTSSDIKVIIEACSANLVSEITFGDLHIKFSSAEIEQKSLEINSEIKQPDAQVEHQAIVAEEVSLREDDLANMILSDPAEYERLQVLGELEDAGYHRTEQD